MNTVKLRLWVLVYSLQSFCSSELLRPLQYGVGVRGGCEGIVHATRATLASESIPQESKWCLQVDLENGFNLCSRDHMFNEVRRLLPSLTLRVVLAIIKEQVAGAIQMMNNFPSKR